MSGKPKHILVLGDPIIDRYINLEPSGIAQEAPIAKYRMTADGIMSFPGGASNVAAQIRTLLVNTDWTVREYPGGGIFGDKASAKMRGVVGSTEVFRYDRDETTPEITQEDLDRLAIGVDAIVVSDYEKGAFKSPLTFPKEIPLFIDCKNPYKYPTVFSTFFPNAKEYSAGCFNGDGTFLVTKGAEGASLIQQYGPKGCRDDIKSPLPTTHPTSVIGAGDIVVAAYTVANLIGFHILDCADIAIAAASLAVTKPYTPNITVDELQNYFLTYSGKVRSTILDFCEELT